MPRRSPKTMRSPSPSMPRTASQLRWAARATAAFILPWLVGLGEPVGKLPSGMRRRGSTRTPALRRAMKSSGPARAVVGVEDDGQAVKLAGLDAGGGQGEVDVLLGQVEQRERAAGGGGELLGAVIDLADFGEAPHRAAVVTDGLDGGHRELDADVFLGVVRGGDA